MDKTIMLKDSVRDRLIFAAYRNIQEAPAVLSGLDRAAMRMAEAIRAGDTYWIAHMYTGGLLENREDDDGQA